MTVYNGYGLPAHGPGLGSLEWIPYRLCTDVPVTSGRGDEAYGEPVWDEGFGDGRRAYGLVVAPIGAGVGFPDRSR